MQFSGGKSMVLHLGRRNQMHRYRIGGTYNSNYERDLVVLVDHHLRVSGSSVMQLPRKSTQS